MFRIVSGRAIVSTSSEYDGRSCVILPRYCRRYNEACTVEVLQTGLLSATEFRTESHFDIGGTLYPSGPSNLPVTAGTTFSCYVARNTCPGWTICYAAAR